MRLGFGRGLKGGDWMRRPPRWRLEALYAGPSDPALLADAAGRDAPRARLYAALLKATAPEAAAALPAAVQDRSGLARTLDARAALLASSGVARLVAQFAGARPAERAGLARDLDAAASDVDVEAARLLGLARNAATGACADRRAISVAAAREAPALARRLKPAEPWHAARLLPQISWSEAIGDVLASLDRLHPDLSAAARLGLDAGRIDAAAHGAKAAGFSHPGVGDGAWACVNFTGLPGSLAVLAHELGHLAAQGQGPAPDRRTGETHAILAELALMRQRVNRDGAAETRADTLFVLFVRMAAIALFERAWDAEPTADPAALAALWQEAFAFCAPHMDWTGYGRAWMLEPMLFAMPGAAADYAFAACAAARLDHVISLGGRNAGATYLTLLREGAAVEAHLTALCGERTMDEHVAMGFAAAARLAALRA